MGGGSGLMTQGRAPRGAHHENASAAVQISSGVAWP